MGPGNFFSSGMWIIPLGMMVLCAVLFRLGVFPGRFRRPNSGTTETDRPKATAETALEILQKRYAKGEITQGEFEAMKKSV
ncbi:MAG: SHOCT domain-containing protein [Myxococcota bacterium]